MFARLSLGLLLLAAVPLWSQVEPDASGGPASPDDEYSMSMPEQVSGRSYSMGFGPGARSNYLSGGLIYTTAYDDNIFAGGDAGEVGNTSFAIVPVIGISRTTPRTTSTLNYGAGFTFYHPTTSLNSVNQNAALDFEYRLTRHSSLGIQDTFQQNSSPFTQPYTFSGTTVSGSPTNQPGPVIVPYASQLSNSTNIQYGYQFSRDAMVGAGGSYNLFNYANLQDVPGLNNSNAESGTGFYTRRLTESQFIGVTYQYGRITTNPVDTTTHTQVISVFYTVKPNKRFTLALTAGPEYFDTQEVGFAKASSWGEFILASLDWTGTRTGVAATYSRSVTSGQGLIGAYSSDTFDLSGRWLMARTWTAGVSGTYSNYSNAIPVAAPSTPGGHTIFGTVSIQHTLGEHFNVEADYRRLHQTYQGISASTNPNDNRVSVAISYQFTRPVGR
jgi:hypothetical protein